MDSLHKNRGRNQPSKTGAVPGNLRLRGKVEFVLVGEDMKYEKIGEVGDGIEVRMLSDPSEPETGVGRP